MGTRAWEDNYHNYILLFIILFLFSVIFSFLLKRKAKTRLQLPPGPYAWPVIGNILDLDTENPHTWLANLAQEYGQLFSLKFGTKVVVIASSPAAAKEVLKTRDRDLSGRFKSRLIVSMPEFQSSVIVLSTECSEKWRFLRRNAHIELFSAAALEVHAKLRARKAQEMFDFLVSKEGEVLQIVNIIYIIMVNTMTNTLMSKDLINSLDYPVGDLKNFSRELVGFVVPSMADMFSMGAIFDFATKRTALEYKKKSRALWGDTVRERRGKTQEVGASSRDFLDVLMKNSFEDGEIYNVFNELFVTSDSIGTTIEWAISELTRNQEAFSRLRDEIAETIEGKTILRESKLANLPYLQACIKETLRLHPPSPFLVPHCALETCKVMNYDVPKNSVVAVNVYAIGRDPKTWEDPISFKPERFLGKNLDIKGTHYELLPFSAGRRICIGMPLALKQMQLILASLVYAFDWVLPSGIDPAKLDMSDKFSVPLGRAKPLLLIFKKRNNLKIE